MCRYRLAAYLGSGERFGRTKMMCMTPLRLLLMRPASWLQVLAYAAVMFVLASGIGLAAGRPHTWLLTAVALSLGTLLAGALHLASRED
jgi:hypothetical protein